MRERTCRTFSSLLLQPISFGDFPKCSSLHMSVSKALILTYIVYEEVVRALKLVCVLVIHATDDVHLVSADHRRVAAAPIDVHF